MNSADTSPTLLAHLAPDIQGQGEAMHRLCSQLFPICRSITGKGLRDTLSILQQYMPLSIQEVPTGTQVLDWSIPNEWNIKDAYIKDAQGKRVVDFQKHNLHILNYSVPVRGKFTLAQLKPHLFSLPEQPTLIPYRTSYYQENWGFCLSHRQLASLEEGEYEVCIDSELAPGALSYGELYLPGESEAEVLFSTHVCHPSLANDNLSGIAVMTYLASGLMKQSRRQFSYRFLFIPGTIGAITWLAQHAHKMPPIRYGLVASLLGDRGNFTYKKSRQGDAEIDRIVAYVLKQTHPSYQIKDFFPYGYDERQFCSPGFNLPVGNLSRTPFGEFPQYHNSGDNLSFIQAEHLEASLHLFREIVKAIETNKTYLNLVPKGEPQLGKRGLYQAMDGNPDRKAMQMAMLWILNLSDGQHSLLDIALRSGIALSLLSQVAELLVDHSLLRPLPHA